MIIELNNITQGIIYTLIVLKRKIECGVCVIRKFENKIIEVFQITTS
jgi:hypothetical protein